MKTSIMQKVKNRLFVFSLLATILTLTYCTNQGKDQSRKSLTDFKAYVKEHKDASARYMNDKWDDIEKEYDEKKSVIDKDINDMDEEMKASYEATLADWESFKADYQQNQKEKAEQARAEQFKAAIVPKDVNTNLSNVTGKNIADVFEHFVNTVDNKKELYSKEEWININDYWKRLNNLSARLDEERKITREDSRKMDGIRIKYMAIKTLNKPFAESDNK